MNIIAQNIVKRRKELKMTQKELAEKLNISSKTVSRWETGNQIPDALTIPEIAKVLTMTIDELYGQENKNDYEQNDSVKSEEESETEDDFADLSSKQSKEYPNLRYGVILSFKIALIAGVFAFFGIGTFIAKNSMFYLGSWNLVYGMSFAGVILYLLLQAVLYYRFKQDIWEKRSEITDELWLTTFQKCALKTKLNNEIIEFSSVTNIVQPCTVGIWNKSILIPESLIGTLTESEIDIVLCHELTHIRKNHVALKVLIFVLSSLNWFNPILHMLRNSLSEWIEISCDEDLTVVESGEDREAYANMLIKLSSAVTEQRKYGKINAITYFGTRKRVKLLKKRIIGIMKKEQNPDRMAKTLTIAGIICAVCLSTIIAKEMDIAMNAAFSNHVAVFDESEIIVEEVTAIDEGYEYIDFDEDLFEKQVAGSTEMDSSISYEIVYMDSSSELLAAPIMTAMCEHQMEKVNIVEHTKNTDGSCVVLMHEGMHCRECVKTVFGGIIYTSSMAECVH